MSDKPDKFTQALALLGIGLAVASLIWNGYTWYLSSGYSPSITVVNVTPLTLNQDCVTLINGGPKYCKLSGTFNIHFTIISPHAGTYQIALLNASFLSQNSTVPVSPTATDSAGDYNIEGLVTANGFDNTTAVIVSAFTTRPSNYTFNPGQSSYGGWMVFLLSYTDAQSKAYFKQQFEVTTDILDRSTSSFIGLP
ncbi:MAG TPA: hypothetical protein VJZ03_06750 [Candidatus Bathyarchaeia archaeon]|nr:hypothetical protein [Candidatus Bathyarchaeia archaeon]